jgi:hypothetical protein
LFRDHLYSKTIPTCISTSIKILSQTWYVTSFIVVASFIVDDHIGDDHIEPSFHLGGDIADSAKGEGGPGLLPNLSLL